MFFLKHGVHFFTEWTIDAARASRDFETKCRTMLLYNMFLLEFRYYCRHYYLSFLCIIVTMFVQFLHECCMAALPLPVCQLGYVSPGVCLSVS